MALFQDRIDAGRQLARRLAFLKGSDTVVLGLPRGGIVVAHEVAKALQAPLEALVVRKIGHRFDSEAAVGAMGPDGKVHYSTDGFREASGHADEYAAIVRKEKAELRRRQDAYGLERLPDLSGRTALVVDDGIATGATMQAALEWLKGRKPARIVVAAPCAHPDAIQAIRDKGHDVVCLEPDPQFKAVGAYFKRFEQTDEPHVRQILARHRRLEKNQ